MTQTVTPCTDCKKTIAIVDHKPKFTTSAGRIALASGVTGEIKEVRMGRVRPKSLHFVGRFMVLETPDGRVRSIPRLVAHYNSAQDRHLRRAVVPPPTTVDWSAKAAAAIAQMDGNDNYGDCVIADTWHRIGVWTANAGSPVLSSGTDYLTYYHTICGPGDNGCVITDVLDYWQKNGVTVGGHLSRIAGYAAVDFTNKQLVQACIADFASFRVGINLPQAWTSTNTTWGQPSGAGAQIVGGHDVGACGYDDGGVYFMTWGGKVYVPWAVLLDPSKTYFEEAYVELGLDWFAVNNTAPNGIDGQTLAIDLALVQSGQVPPFPGGGPPPPPPPPPGGPTLAQAQQWLAKEIAAVGDKEGWFARPGVYALGRQLGNDLPSFWQNPAAAPSAGEPAMTDLLPQYHRQAELSGVGNHPVWQLVQQLIQWAVANGAKINWLALPKLIADISAQNWAAIPGDIAAVFGGVIPPIPIPGGSNQLESRFGATPPTQADVDNALAAVVTANSTYNNDNAAVVSTQATLTTQTADLATAKSTVSAAVANAQAVFAAFIAANSPST